MKASNAWKKMVRLGNVQSLLVLINIIYFQVQTRRKAVNKLWLTFNRIKWEKKNKLHMAGLK